MKQIFSKLLPTSYLKDIAPFMKWGVLEIAVTDISLPGIIAEVTSIIADSKISIKQIVVGYPELLEEEHLFIITERSLPGTLIPRIKAVKSVKEVSIH